MSYVTLDDIKLELTQGFLSQYANADAVITNKIAEAEAEVNARLAAAGYTAPATDPEDVKILGGVVKMKTLDALYALNSVQGGANGQTERGRIAEATLSGIADGSIQLKAPRTAQLVAYGGDGDGDDDNS